jgi:hypothetical protein
LASPVSSATMASACTRELIPGENFSRMGKRLSRARRPVLNGNHPAIGSRSLAASARASEDAGHVEMASGGPGGLANSPGAVPRTAENGFGAAMPPAGRRRFKP